MALLPRTPDGWLSDDPTNDIGFDMPYTDDTGAGTFNGARGILSAASSDPMPPGNSLSLLMERHEIASVPGLPEHVYQAAGTEAGKPVQNDRSRKNMAIFSMVSP